MTSRLAVTHLTWLDRHDHPERPIWLFTMPKRPRASSSPGISTSCLSGWLFLIGGLTFGVDLYYWQQPSGSSRPRLEPTTTSHGPESLLRANRFPLNKDHGIGGVSYDSNDTDPVLAILHDAGLTHLDPAIRQQLPSWQQVTNVWGTEPIIYGLDSCQIFRQSVLEDRRMLGAAGMFSTGTNLVTHLLKQNCLIPARVTKYGLNASKEQLGMRWQVPWCVRLLCVRSP